MTPELSRPLQLLRNACLGASTAIGMATEDPLLLLVQAARRLPAGPRARLASLLAANAADSPRAAVAAWLAGHDDDARRLVTTHLARGGSGRWQLPLAELGVLLDVPGAGGHGSAATRAREAMREGDVSRAAQHSARYASELRLMSPSAPSGWSGTRSSVRNRPLGERNRPLTVLHVLTNSLPHTQSGYAVRSHEVLRAQRSAGIEAEAATRVGYPISVGKAFAREHDLVDGIGYTRLVPWRSARTPGARLAQQLTLLRPLAARVAPDLLHTTTNYTNALVTRALARELGVPWVYEVRGILEDTWVASFPEHLQAQRRASEKHRLLRAREAELAAAADAVVTLGEGMARDLAARGVPRERITVIPNGVDASLLARETAPSVARERLGLPREGRWVGSVSSLVAYEGFETVLRAVARARGEGHDVRVLLVGDGTDRPRLVALAEELGLGETAVMPGRVATDDAADWYEALDVFAVPRRDTAVTRAVTPLKPVTAMALGRPVLASDLPALAETVGAAVAAAGGLVAADDNDAWADAIVALTTDAERYATLASAGREVAAGRTWDAIGDQYRELYAGLLDGGARTSTGRSASQRTREVTA